MVKCVQLVPQFSHVSRCCFIRTDSRFANFSFIRNLSETRYFVCWWIYVNLEIRYEYLRMIRSITFCSGKARPCWSTRNILKQEPPQLGSLPYMETNEGSAQDLVRGVSNAVFMTRAVTVVYCRTVPELVTVGLFTPSNLQTWQLKGSGMACALLQMEISTRSQAWSNLKKWTFTEERCVVRNYADSWRADVELGLCMLHTWHDLNTA